MTSISCSGIVSGCWDVCFPKLLLLNPRGHAKGAFVEVSTRKASLDCRCPSLGSLSIYCEGFGFAKNNGDCQESFTYLSSTQSFTCCPTERCLRLRKNKWSSPHSVCTSTTFTLFLLIKAIFSSRCCHVAKTFLLGTLCSYGTHWDLPVRMIFHCGRQASVLMSMRPNESSLTCRTLWVYKDG